jgi:hypothetical protein
VAWRSALSSRFWTTRPSAVAPPRRRRTQAQRRGQGRLRRGPHAGRLTALRRRACRSSKSVLAVQSRS